jgi:hypothetical protein
MNASAVQQVAIAKALSKKAVDAARKGAEPGNYTVDMHVHVTGDMTIGEDYNRQVPQTAKPWALLAAALSHLNGVTMESIVREALEQDPALEGSIKTSATEALTKLKGPCTRTCAGRMKVDLETEVEHGTVEHFPLEK